MNWGRNFIAYESAHNVQLIRAEYDSPPIALAGKGRLDSPGFPIMYGSQDIDVCIHECRASTDDDIYVATLEPKRNLRLLDLLISLLEEDVTEFESLDMAYPYVLPGSHPI